MGFLDPTDPSHTPGSLLLRRLMLRGGTIVLAGLGILVAPSVEEFWAETTSTCTKVITPDDLVTLGGKKASVERAYHCEYFCDASYGEAASVSLDKDTYHSAKKDEAWVEDAKKDGATVETVVDGSAWLAVNGKFDHALIVKREFGVAKVTLKTSDFTAEQARKLYPLLKDRWQKVDDYFAEK